MPGARSAIGGEKHDLRLRAAKALQLPNELIQIHRAAKRHAQKHAVLPRHAVAF